MISSLVSAFRQRLGRANSRGAPATSPENDLLPVLAPEALLAHPARQVKLRELHELAAVPDDYFDTLYGAAITAFARFTQQLPASESHHHAGAGGLLDHTLEVAVTALSLRRGMLLPVGAEPDTLVREQDVWTYAVFAGALLHDIGKPAVDLRVILFDAAGLALGPWDPWSGPMRSVRYRVHFNRQRCYGLHTRAAPLLARLILPPAGLSWLASDQAVLAAWLATLSGDREAAGTLGEIIMRADSESVARNLGAGDTSRFAAAVAVPLHEKLLTALRHLLSAGALPLNRNGAAGWLSGDDLWLVSKRAVDALRDHLIKEGHTGIPTRNDRLFDVLQEHNILLRNGDQAIWRATVAGEGWAHDLTLLRLPAGRVWPNPEARPPAFDGTVAALPGAAAPEEGGQEPGASCDITSGETATHGTTHAPVEDEEHPGSGKAAVGKAIFRQDRLGERSEPAEDDDEGKRFLAWLRKELAEWRLKINQADARVHIVPEGVLLVSPAVFKDFARAHGGSWEHVQKRFLKLKIHQRAADDTNIHHYTVERPGGNHNKKAETIKGIVIADASAVFAGETPAANPVLRPTGS